MAADPIVSELLAHRGWMRAIARELTRDEAAAEDLVQDTLVAALQSPPRAPGALRSWVRTVMRRRGLALLRSGVAREAREQSTTAGRELPTPDEAAARAEVQQRVVRAVMALDEPYRGTLLLRFFEDAGPTEIGERMGVPVETVRTRVRRGLALVRHRLTEEDDEPGAWRAALLAWLDLAPPAKRVGPEAGAVTGLAGGVVVGLGWKLAAGAALVLAGWWAWGGGDGVATSRSPYVDHAAATPAVSGTSSRSRVDSDGTNAVDETSTRSAGTTGTTAPEAESGPTPVTHLAGTVRSGTQPIAGARITLSGRHAGETAPTIECESDADGRYSIALAGLGLSASTDVEVHVDAAQFLPATLLHALPADADNGIEVFDVALERAVFVRGRLVDPRGAPLADHPVALVEMRPRSSRVTEEIRTGTGGEFALRGEPESMRQLVAVSPERPPAQKTIAIGKQDRRVGDIVVPDGVGVAVRVHTNASIAAEEVVVVADPFSSRSNQIEIGGVGLIVRDGVVTRGKHPFHRDGDVWRARGYADGESVYVRAYPRGAVYDLQRKAELGTADGPYSDGIFRVTVAPASVDLHVHAVRTRIHVLEGDRPVGAGVGISIWMGVGTNGLRTDAEGVATTWLTPGQKYELRASGATYAQEVFSETIPADADEHEIWLRVPDPDTLATVSISFDDGDASPRLLGISVSREQDGERDETGGGVVRPGEDGTFVLSGLPTGRHRLIARIDQGRWGASGYWLPHEEEIDLVGGETVSLNATMKRGGRLRLVSKDQTGTPVRTEIALADAAGNAVEFHTIMVVPEGLGMTNQSCQGENGVEVVPVLQPGRYRITFTPKNGEPVTLDAEVEEGRTTVVEREFPAVD